ncbi:MAG: hypothetical protein E6H10_03560 [Bacteroidetes bacterium]|nr:MAG: hypothetical protein E6H10_03560 [Bacteroidota bacterium]
MEKTRFTMRFIILLASFPVLIFSELTREDKGTTEQKQSTVETISQKNDVAAVSYHSPFLQAIL